MVLKKEGENQSNDGVKYGKLLHSRGVRKILHKIKRMKAKRIGQMLRKNSVLNDVTERKI
jgi:hypothetical protein